MPCHCTRIASLRYFIFSWGRPPVYVSYFLSTILLLSTCRYSHLPRHHLTTASYCNSRLSYCYRSSTAHSFAWARSPQLTIDDRGHPKSAAVSSLACIRSDCRLTLRRPVESQFSTFYFFHFYCQSIHPYSPHFSTYYCLASLSCVEATFQL